VRNIRRRMMELERDRGKGQMVHHLHILYDGETAPESKDPNAVTLIMDLGGPRPAEEKPDREKH
jgi:hypothetical protein